MVSVAICFSFTIFPFTRSTSSTEYIISYIDEKFNNKFDELNKSNEELKLRIIDEIRNEVKALVEEPLKKLWNCNPKWKFFSGKK